VPLVPLSQIKKNTLFSFISSSVRLVANILFFVAVARVFGPRIFGQFTIAQVLYTVFLLVADFGTDTLFITEISRAREEVNSIFEEFFSTKLILWVIAAGLMCLVTVVKNFNWETDVLIYIFSVNVVFTASMNFFFALFKGHEQFRYETAVTFMINLCLLLGTVGLIFVKAAPWGYAALFGATRLLGVVFCVFISRKFLEWEKINFRIKHWNAVLKRGWVFGVHLTFGTLYFQLDTIILTFLQGDLQVGIYQAAMKLLTVVLIIPDIASSVFLPVLSRYNSFDEERWLNSGKTLAKTLSLIGLPISVIFIVFSEQIIRVLYGPDVFLLSVTVLRLFGIVALIRFSAEIFALMLTTSMRQDFRMKVVILATLLNLVLNLYAIPAYGVTGAAVVSIVTNIFSATGYLFGMRKWLIAFMPDRKYFLLFGSAIVLSVIMWFLRGVSVFVMVPIFLIVYSYLFYKVGLNTQERALIFNESTGQL
jgi:O-antigen/teichoic acid export membrane protein